MQNGGKTTIIKTYYCGYCVNKLHHMYKNMPKQSRNFPALAVLFSHKDDYYLFDTGYSKRVFENGIKSKIYNKLNPIVFNEDDSLIAQLAHDGVTAKQIKGIVVSHLHPDHIGGLKDFSHSEIMLSKKTYGILKKPKLLDLVFKNLIPKDIEKRIKVIDEDKYDMFGDGTVIAIDLSGHTAGQIGLHFTEHNVLFASDACWGLDFLDKKMKFFARKLQRDYKNYDKSIAKVKEFMNRGIKVIVSHEAVKNAK